MGQARGAGVQTRNWSTCHLLQMCSSGRIHIRRRVRGGTSRWRSVCRVWAAIPPSAKAVSSHGCCASPARCGLHSALSFGTTRRRRRSGCSRFRCAGSRARDRTACPHSASTQSAVQSVTPRGSGSANLGQVRRDPPPARCLRVVSSAGVLICLRMLRLNWWGLLSACIGFSDTNSIRVHLLGSCLRDYYNRSHGWCQRGA